MRLLAFLPLMLVAACQAATPADEVGSDAWLAWVDRELAVSDDQGHGPDYDTQEWCNMAHLRLHGLRAVEPVVCDLKWMQEVDAALRKR